MNYKKPRLPSTEAEYDVFVCGMLFGAAVSTATFLLLMLTMVVL